MGEYKFTIERRAIYLASLRKGARRGQAAEACGVTSQCVRDYIERDPDFKDAIDEAEIAAHEAVENALWHKAKNGNVQAIVFWLTNRMPDKWQNVNRHEFRGQIAALSKGEVDLKLAQYDNLFAAMADFYGDQKALPEAETEGETVVEEVVMEGMGKTG